VVSMSSTHPRTARENAEFSVIYAIDRWHIEHGYGPAFRDVAEATGFALGTVHGLCRSLRDQGRVIYDDQRARSLDVTH
jgi:DNA-binding IclR family transcriptional regulator